MSVWMSRNPTSENLEVFEPEQFQRQGVNEKAFLNIVTIAGSARTGKSTLMNRLVGSNVFKTSNSRLGCTKGVCLCDVQETSDNGIVAFVDTEGKGNNNLNNDNKLLTPVVLLSKVVILNVWKQVLIERHLEELELFVHIGERIKLSDEYPLTFGHLIIAVRDYNFNDGTDKEVYNDYFQIERSTNNDAVKRNEIRRKLLSMFQSIQVRLFRQPLNTTQNNPKIEQLKNEIHDKVSEPRYIVGETVCLTPGNVGDLVKNIVDQLNSNKELVVLSVVGLLQRQEIFKAYQKCMNCLLEIFNDAEEPIAWSGLEESLKRQKDQLIQQFERDTEKADFESQYRTELKQKLEREFTRRLARTKVAVERLQRNEVKEAASDFKSKLDENFNRILEELPKEDDRIIEQSTREDKTRLLAIFHQRTNGMDLVSNFSRQFDTALNQYCQEKINAGQQENKRQIICVQSAKEAFKRKLAEKFGNLPVENRCDLRKKLQSLTHKAFATFDQDTEYRINNLSEYKRRVKQELELFSDNLQREKLNGNDERLRERQLVDNEKSKFERSMKSSFERIILPVIQTNQLKVTLKEKEERNFAEFDFATEKVNVELDYKTDSRRSLKLFAMGETNGMLMKNFEKIQENAINPGGLLIAGTAGLSLGSATAVGVGVATAVETSTLIAASSAGGIGGFVVAIAIYAVCKKTGLLTRLWSR